MADAHALRPVTLVDAEILSTLHAHGPDEPWSADAFARLLVLPGTFGVLATVPSNDGAVPVGFVLARAAADEAEILTINVSLPWRRHGIGRALLRAAMSQARDARRLLLEVAEGNRAALALYDRCGFRPVGRRIAYYARAGGAREDALILALSLHASANATGLVQSTVKSAKGLKNKTR